MSENIASLRDIRRLLARRQWVRLTRGEAHVILDVHIIYHKWVRCRVPWEVWQERPENGITTGISRVDWLISRLGPDWTGAEPLPEKGDPKQTPCSMPRGSSDAGIPRGGQDGSAEPPHAAAAPAEAGEATADGPPTAEASPGQGQGEPAAEPGQPPQAAPVGSGKPDSGEARDRAPSDTPGCDAPGRDRDGASPAPADNPTAATQEPAAAERAGTPEGLPVTDGSDSRSAAEEAIAPPPLEDQTWNAPVRTPLWRHGGTFDDRERAELLALAGKRSAREVRRALERLLQALDLGGVEDSPRLAGGRLVRELTSRRCQIARARRRELAIPLVVLACDVSGSCSAVCTETLAACLATAEKLAHVVVARHSNGWLCRRHDDDSGPGLAGWCRTWAQKRSQPLGAVVAFGDWDAGHEYQTLCESGAKLIWLDSYCCSWGVVRPASRFLRDQAAGWSRQPLAWYQGVNDARSAAVALRAAARLARRER